MASNRQFIKEINEYVATELARQGFLRSGDHYFLQGGPRVSGLASVTVTTHRGDGYIGVGPFIGIEHESIRDALNQLLGKRKGTLPSLTSQIGYLMPEKRSLEWLLDPAQPVTQREELLHVSTAIGLYGARFLQEFGSLDAIVRCLENCRYCFCERVIYHLPVAYRIQEREQEAQKLVRESLAKVASRQDLAAADYRAFAERFLTVASST